MATPEFTQLLLERSARGREAARRALQELEENTPRNHLPLLARCAVCAGEVLQHERVVALYGDGATGTYGGRTRRPFAFPQPGYTFLDEVDGGDGDGGTRGYRPCRTPGCFACSRSPESVPAHHDCFVVFMHEYRALLPSGIEAEAEARLWTVGCFRSPWPKALALLRLRSPAGPPPQGALARVVGAADFGGGLGRRLLALPPELVAPIRQLDPHALLWRAVAAVELARRVAATPPPPPPPSSPSVGAAGTMTEAAGRQHLLAMPLADVAAWERGGEVLRISEPSPRRPVVKITIDSEGICKIERLSELPPMYRPDLATDSRAYIVEEEGIRDFCEAQVHVKDRLLRLCLPAGIMCPRIWDTPEPPPLHSPYMLSYNLLSYWRRYRTVNFERAHGVTFFFLKDGFRGVHVHEDGSAASCAMSALGRLSHRSRRRLLWLYFPTPPADKVVAMSMRGLTQVAFTTELTGEVVLGAALRAPVQFFKCGSSERVTMVYGEGQDDAKATCIGGFAGPSRGPPPQPVRVPGFRPENMLRDETPDFFSTAPLEMVASASVLYNPETGCCRGILFEYKNGGQRVVGQYRVHVDPERRYAEPTSLWLREKILPADSGMEARGFEVDFGTENISEDEQGRQHPAGDGWDCYALSGDLEFLFSFESSLLYVVQQQVD